MYALRHLLLPLAAAALFALPAAAQTPLPKPAEPLPVQTALAGPAALAIPGIGTVDGVLSAADVERYRRVFELQESGNWKQADAIIRRIDDDRLMGHVLAQRYLHPTKYRSRFSELRDWMARYADLPQADRIHRLAVRRQPKGAAGPKAPVRHSYRTVGTETAIASERRRASTRSHRLYTQIKARALRGWPTGALEMLNSAAAQRDMAPWQADEARREIARAYFRAGKDAEALAMAQQVLAHTGESPLAYWWGGLAAWRLGRIEDSQRLFTLLAQSDRASEWAVSSGAFWASRAYLVGGRPEQVNDMLALGAAHPLTFYGLLSRAALGLELPLDWTQPAIAHDDLERIAQTGYGSRALALIQVGREAEAEPELRNLVAADPATGPAVLSLSVRAGLPALSLRLAGYGATPDLAVAAWPMPDWEPEEGFAIDRALVFAFIRQESAFNARARSHAGARGLMQLMPRTASYIAGERALHGRGKHRLFDPEFNMALGQRYIAYLIATDGIGTDLFRLAAAYNAGPGNLRRWESAIDYMDDPLLFIESLPSRETRLFIERILTNFWIYRDRLDQEAPSLDDVVSGTWPAYVAQDEPAQDDNSHARH
ncbi:unnamed protein product [Discosporangium mesarthrocarpum]